MNNSRAVSSRVVLSVIVALVVVAITGAAVLSVLRPAPDLDPWTPEGVAQAYYQAILDGEEADALALMSPEIQQRCRDRDFRFFFVANSGRVVLTSTEVREGRAEVEVEIDKVSDPSLFDLESYSTHERLVMTETATGWPISEVPWPFHCPEGS